ncbi:MAG: sensor histidine kinase [Thermodesulfovibrionales bacterium]
MMNTSEGLARPTSRQPDHLLYGRTRLTLLMFSATNLRAIITNILDLSKIEAGKMEVIYECFDLSETLREVGETTRVLLGNKPVDVEVIADPSNHYVVLDPIKVRQILTNLLSKAAKFTDKASSTCARKSLISFAPADKEVCSISEIKNMLPLSNLNTRCKDVLNYLASDLAEV